MSLGKLLAVEGLRRIHDTVTFVSGNALTRHVTDYRVDLEL